MKLGIPQFAKIPAHPWIKAWTDRALIAGFALLLVLPSVAALFDWNPYALLGENRNLASAPVLNEQPLAKWPGMIDGYYRDHFGLRNAFVHANNVVLRLWLHVSAEALVIGKDGWTFFRGPNELIFENHLGLDPLSGPQLDFWKSYLEERQRNRASRGIKSLFVIAPDKQSIYPEMLPDQYAPRGQTRVDQLMAYLRETNSPVNIVDLRPVLLKAKGEGLLYFPNDSHWNGRGYFAAYREISNHLRQWFPDLPVQRLGVDYGIKRIFSNIGEWGHVALPDENLKFPSDLLVPIAGTPASVAALDLPPRFPNPVAPWLTAKSTHSLSGRHRLLMFHDSFMSYGVADRTEGPLTRDFEATLSIGRYLPEAAQYELEGKFHPDVVVEEWVERQMVAPR